MKNAFFYITIAGVAALLFTQSCSSDKEQLLAPACDTSNVTYSGTIVPILSANCYSCHAGTTPVAPFRLDSHAAVAVQAGNGKLWGALSHSAGFVPMPKDAPKLSDCNLTKIKKWLDAGFPNN